MKKDPSSSSSKPTCRQLHLSHLLVGANTHSCGHAGMQRQCHLFLEGGRPHGGLVGVLSIPFVLTPRVPHLHELLTAFGDYHFQDTVGMTSNEAKVRGISFGTNSARQEGKRLVVLGVQCLRAATVSSTHTAHSTRSELHKMRAIALI